MCILKLKVGNFLMKCFQNCVMDHGLRSLHGVKQGQWFTSTWHHIQFLLPLSLACTVSRKQTVLLLSERARRDTEKLVSSVIKECSQIDILTRRSACSTIQTHQVLAISLKLWINSRLTPVSGVWVSQRCLLLLRYLHHLAYINICFKHRLIILDFQPALRSHHPFCHWSDWRPNFCVNSGSLSSTRSFQKVAADKARSIVLLGNKADT